MSNFSPSNSIAILGLLIGLGVLFLVVEEGVSVATVGLGAIAGLAGGLVAWAIAGKQGSSARRSDWEAADTAEKLRRLQTARKATSRALAGYLLLLSLAVVVFVLLLDERPNLAVLFFLAPGVLMVALLIWLAKKDNQLRQ